MNPVTGAVGDLSLDDRVKICPRDASGRLLVTVLEPTVAEKAVVEPRDEPYPVSEDTARELFRVRRAAPFVKPEPTAKKEPPTSEVSHLNRQQLEAKAVELGIDITSITGTGSGGNVKNGDIEAAIVAKLAEVK